MAEPKLSVILATDVYSTIRPVVDRLRRQTVHHHIELVLVAPSVEAVAAVMPHQGEFAGIRIVEDPVEDLGTARAAGIRAAAAPFVFIGETHSYPHPGFSEALMRHFAEPWSVILPAFGNANPKGALSWAGFVSDYGAWVEGLPAGEVSHIPIYNAAFRRQALLDLGDRLDPAISHGDELPLALHAAGHRAYFEPEARLDHVNVASLGHWVKERFAAGVMIAASRSLRWTFGRRVFYVFASPLIPVVLSWRVLPGVWLTIRQKKLPLSTAFWFAAGMAVKAAGELLGYAGAPVKSWERQLHEYEVHKLAYAGKGVA